MGMIDLIIKDYENRMKFDHDNVCTYKNEKNAIQNTRNKYEDEMMMRMR